MAQAPDTLQSGIPQVDTVVVGSGPAALILSFILHGNVPYYDTECSHPDPILHSKLETSRCLLDLDVDELTAHFDASRLSYSTQALPINVLLDTLLRPLADVEPGKHESMVSWVKKPRYAISHRVIGSSPQPGGQWSDNPVRASLDIGALSYLDQLSLPGYTLYDHLGVSRQSLTSSTARPTKRQLAEYFAAYPAAVGIEDSIQSDSAVSGVKRTSDGFFIASHNLHCKHLVLASGVFTSLLPPPPDFAPLSDLSTDSRNTDGPLLVIGSGFSAADIIISNIQHRKIIHIFRWGPKEKKSPLQACHPQAYPDYAGVYRQMKKAASRSSTSHSVISSNPRKAKSIVDNFLWTENYEGLPNAKIQNIQLDDDGATIEIESQGTGLIEREIESFSCVIGRRGSLKYLDQNLQMEVLNHEGYHDLDKTPAYPNQPISGETLRNKTIIDVEVAKDVFAIGSLTGDSLVRFAHGTCVQAAGRLMNLPSRPSTILSARPNSPKKTPERQQSPILGSVDTYRLTNGHETLGNRHGEEQEADQGPLEDEGSLCSHEKYRDLDQDGFEGVTKGDSCSSASSESSCKCCINFERCTIL